MIYKHLEVLEEMPEECKFETDKVVCGSCGCELDYNDLHVGICDECGFDLVR